MAARKRIASLISSATEILYLLGLGDQVVGVSHECDFPAGISRKPRLTRSLVNSAATSRDIDDQVRSLAAAQSALYAIDVERLAALKPDLIVTQAQCDVCAVRYEDVVQAVAHTPELRGTQIVSLNPCSLEHVFEDILRIGAAANAELAAVRAVNHLRSRVDAVRGKSALPRCDAIPRVACLEWVDPPMLAANWMPELIRWAAGEPGLTVAGQHSGYTDWREITAYDPQIVVIMPCGFDLERSIFEAQSLPERADWQALSAVRERRVFACDGNGYFNRSGPRLVDSLEILAHLFHPSVFAPPHVTSAWRRLETLGNRLIGEES